MHIIKACVTDYKKVAVLFNEYRVFYKQKSDIKAAERFIYERLHNKESVIFLALEEAEAVGFAQLYPSFTSIGIKRIIILNDLYVTEKTRGSGVGAALLQKVKEYGKQEEIGSIVLQTAKDNARAQHLYEKLGYQKDDHYFYYSLSL
ncbi:N-acetyltransferase family protein [Priestia endophytica]|jgi:ribosomal protein S18 acetylase RimI-like enzyme|uniref:Acetyltransferase (GNAT) family protein n=1 Tax=Priestia endophytica DSM 13796 TaxID=1121089 RepID=A0A1I5W5B7_9BACI|nr:GNAT family N-acetyltransferase [Priestia endophytica]KYG35989.1 acetyltransferase [Priestia endophytica]MBG9814933.1 acetyltransferase [Priestia endophytica]SFQ14932.1 Acetyltransferase (GNAT) family protein [Priestia endophytica DSM 13796]